MLLRQDRCSEQTLDLVGCVLYGSHSRCMLGRAPWTYYRLPHWKLVIDLDVWLWCLAGQIDSELSQNHSTNVCRLPRILDFKPTTASLLTWLMLGKGLLVTDRMGARRRGCGVVSAMVGYGDARLEPVLNPCRTPPKLLELADAGCCLRAGTNGRRISPGL